MYTVFTPSMRPKTNWAGLVIFVRTLSEARQECTQPGERIIGWASSGYARTVWECGDDGKIRVVPKER